MKKILLSVLGLVLAVSSMVAEACPNNPQKIVSRIQAHNVTAIQITYSPDMQSWAQDIQKGISGLDNSLTIKMIPATGTGVCTISKA